MVPAGGDPSPAPSASFLALEDNGTVFTPDTQGAVGTNYLMVALASQIRIQDRAGNPINTMSLDSFWTGVTSPNPAVFDPRLVYDPYSHRWIFVAVANYTNNPGLLLAVSQTGDPTQIWYRWFIDVDTSAPLYAVAPTVGFNRHRVIIQANMYYKTNDAHFGSYIYAFTKTNLYAGGSGSPRRFQLLAADQGPEENAPVPALTYDTTTGTNFLLGNYNGNFQGFGYLQVYMIGGSFGSEALRPGAIVIWGDPWAHHADDTAFLPQAGKTNKLNAGDCRMQSVLLRGGTLWAVQTTFYPTTNPDHCAVQWWEVTPGGTVRQQNTIEDLSPVPQLFYAYPSMSVNRWLDVVIGYTRFSASEYPSAYYSFRADLDAFEILRPEALLKAGQAPYAVTNSSGQVFWGYWSATTVDPANDTDLWTLQEYAANPSGGKDRWGTWWGRVSPPVDLKLTMAESVDPAIQSSNLTYTLTVTNQNFGHTAGGVKIVDTLPAGLTFVSASASQGDCAHAGGVVTCNLGTLDFLERATATITVAPVVAGSITNTAVASAFGPETDPSDNSVSVPTAVLASADLAVLVADAPDPVQVGGSLTYSITVTNRGLSTANGVNLTNTLPAGVNFISANSSAGSCTRSGNVISCPLNMIANQGFATVTIVVAAPTGGLSLTNRTTVRASTIDVDQANNTVTTVTRVNAYPTLQNLGNQSVNEDGTLGPISFTVGDAETPAANLVVTASSSDQAVVPNGNIVIGGSGGTRTITITPATNQSGSTVITRTVTDGDGASTTNLFTLTVNPVNDPPTLNPINPVSMNEDSPPQTITLTGITAGAPNESQVLSITATSSAPAFIAHPSVTYSSPNSSGLLTLAPAANSNGTAVITVIVSDNGPSNSVLLRAFTVVVNPLNDPPTLSPLGDLTFNEDAGQQNVTLSGISTGAANENDNLSITVSNSNPALLTGVNVAYNSPNPTGTLTFGTVSNASGSATVTITVNDNRSTNNLTSRSFNVTVNPVNDSPTLNPINDLTINEDAPAQTVSLTGITSGAANESQTLTVTASNSNPALLTGFLVNYASAATTGTLTFTPAPNAFGSATVTVTVDDGGASNRVFSRTFSVNVSPVNDPPTLDPLGNIVIEEDSGTRMVTVTGIGSGAVNENQMLSLTATSDNPAVVPHPTVSYSTNAPSSGTLSFAPAPNASGAVTITVSVNDGGASNNITNRTFTVTVNPVNDPPTLDPVSDLSINEDAGLQTVNLTGISPGPGNENQPLTVIASNGAPSLLTNLLVNYSHPSSTGQIRFTTAPNASGVTFITVILNDGAGSNNIASRTFTVTVNPVNDPPTLGPIGTLDIDEDSGTHTVALTGIGSGALNESQPLTVTAVSSNANIIPNPISVTYTSPNPMGSLSFAPLANATGPALITVSVRDDGTSNNVTSRSFTVNVKPVNDAPFISEAPDQAADEDALVTVPITVGDLETPANDLSLMGFASNEELVSSGDITFGGTGSNRTVMIRPLTNQFGSATIVLAVSDAEGASTTTSFNLTILPVNDAPGLSAIADVNVGQGVTSPPIPFIVDDPETPPHLLTIWVTSSNPAVVPSDNIVMAGSGVNRSLTITPVAGQLGRATITVHATDGVLTNSTSFQFLVNSLPTISRISDRVTSEDTATGSIAFTVSDPETPAASLVVLTSSSNPEVVATNDIVLSGAGANRAVNITPVPNQFGAATITLTVRDADGGTASSSFLLTVHPQNDGPTISDIPNQTISEDSGTGPLGFTIGDVETPPAALLLSAFSSNPTLVPDSGIVFGGSGASRTVAISPSLNQTGNATITISVTDTNGGSTSNSFVLTVNPVNDPPTLSGIPNLTIDEDTATGPLSFSVSDAETPAANLSVTPTSSNPGLVPNANLALGGSGANRTLTVTPLSNISGMTTITLTVNDNSGGTASTSFVLTVNPVNDPPTLNAINNLIISEDAALQTINLSGISSGAANENQLLTVTATSSNPSIIPNPTVSYNGSSATGTLTFTPVANATGTVTITVRVSDGAASTNRSFTVTVNAVNDLPTITDVANQSTPEDTPITIPFTIGDTETPPYSLTLTATSGNATLVPVANIAFDGAGPNRLVTIQPATNLAGTSLITINLSDGLASVSDSFVLTVTAVNDPPTLNPLPNVYKDAGFANFSVPLSGITVGAPNESQNLTVTAVSSNTALVAINSVSYSSGTTGTLSLKRVNNSATGAAVIAVTVTDNGGAAIMRTFTVFVKASGNSPPTLSAIANQTIQEDTTAGPIPFTVGDAATAASQLTLSGSSSNQVLVPNGNIVFGGSGNNRTVTVTPALHQSGSSIITIAVADTAFGVNSTNFVLTVNPVNDLPVISTITNRAVVEDSSTGPISFTVSDAETPAANLTVTASSSNPTLVPSGGLVVGGYGTNRVLVVTPAPQQSGSANITVSAFDGTANGTMAFTLTVNSVNDPPQISDLPDQTIAEDGNTGSIAFTVGDAETAPASLTLSASSSNPALVPNVNVAFGGAGSSRTVTVTPAPNQFGTAIITVTITDGSGNSTSDTFVLNVSAVNDAPTLDSLSALALNQNAPQQTVTLTGIGTGAANENQTVFLTASSSNPALVPNPAINYTSPGSTATLTFTPLPGVSGSATITVTVNDAQAANNLVSRTFVVTVNGAPTLSSLGPQTTLEDMPLGPITFTVGDDATAANALVVTASSSNPALLPNANISLGGSGANRTLALAPLANRFGVATITLTVADATGGSTSRGFLFIVDTVNDPPTLNPINDVTAGAGSGAVAVNLTGISYGSDTEAQTLTVSAVSSNPSSVPHPTVNYLSPNASGTLVLNVPFGATGSAIITVTAQDSGGTLNGGQNVITRAFNVATVVGPPALNIGYSGGQVILSWPAGATGFSLESRLVAGGGAWTPVSTPPVVSDKWAVVAMPATGPAMFFRLRSQ
jgi:hypothetical protein